MNRASTLAPPVVAALLLFAPAGAGAQSAGAGAGMSDLQAMEQFAPMLETMKRRMGKKRFARLMQTVGPMMDQMMTAGGNDAGGFAAFGGGQTFDMAQMASLIDGPTIEALVDAFAPIERPRSGRRSTRRADR